MKRFPRPLLWLAPVVVVGIAWFLLRPAGVETKEPPRAESRRPVSSQRSLSTHQESGSPDENPPGLPVQASAEVARLIARSLDRFLASTGEVDSKTILEGLRAGIRDADSQEAALAIVDFLKSAKDAPTHLPFVVGPEGVLDLAPTLRTALLDILATLDPSIALDISRQIMDEMKSPDEYAIALRNIAWNNLDGDLKNELSDRLERMIQNSDWSSKPSAGFLEALDASVQLASKRSFESIVSLDVQSIAASNSSLARASLIALDRMVLRDPSLLVDAFKADSNLKGLPPDQRASLMSRLDVTEPKQREVFFRYLSTAVHGDGEMDYFARLFPNGNHIHGNWLITSGEASHSIETRLSADEAVLGEIEKLCAVSVNPAASETLQRIRDRLAKIVSDADTKR